MIEQLFKRVLQEDGLFSEWARLVEADARPATIAIFALERMRSDQDSRAREAYAYFTLFVDCRPWNKVLESIREILTEKEIGILSTEKAERFYLGFRDIIMTAMNDYYEDLAARSPLDQIKDLADVGDQGSRLRLHQMIATEVAAQIDKLGTTITKGLKEQIKRELGEDWKGEEPPVGS